MEQARPELNFVFVNRQWFYCPINQTLAKQIILKRKFRPRPILENPETWREMKYYRTFNAKNNGDDAE